MKTVILDGFAVNPGDLSWSFLEEFGAYEVYDQTPPDQVIARLRGATMAVTNRVRVDRTVIDACPTLRFLSAFGTGYDMIDVAACREAGIEVCNIPGYSTVSVAQLAFTLLLALTTDIPGYRRAVREGRWTGQPDFYYPAIPFTELAGKTVGVYGCGAIGKRFASLCRAFDMRVLASCLRAYGIVWKPSASYACTCSMGRKCYPDLPNHKLNTMCSHLQISLNHHDAASDSHACAELLVDYLHRGFDVRPFIRTYCF